ncbi:MAG: 2-amino-4-hydroxy-6-hydroxymethyldihydropteridine diphosphokinase [Deltaproteobacteria bacterium]|nr:2-amino-4-hydroxy-6-hydroxymethyldihydropteridine diphosphokinase [Deltaproteobacteria bacterium]
MSIVVGFGGNLGSDAEIVARFERAREALAQLGTVRSASLYRSAAIGPEQPAFLNSAVAVAWTDVQPAELIATVLEIERLAGRVRPAPRRGPRHIDLDVLWWGAREVRTPELEVPHPRLAERRFALAPLVELVGEDAAIPGRGRAGNLLARVADQAVERIGSW